MVNKSFFMAVFVLIFLCSSSYNVYAQNTSELKLSVSPMQQKNIDALLLSISNHESLKMNSSFTKTLNEIFSALKTNDVKSYVILLKQFKSEYQKLSQNDKSAYTKFTQSAPHLNPSDCGFILAPPTQGCTATCTYGSCSVKCSGPYRPYCTCDLGMPICECIN